MINQLNVQSVSAESETFRLMKEHRSKKIFRIPLSPPVLSLCKLHILCFPWRRRKVYSDDEVFAALTG